MKIHFVLLAQTVLLASCATPYQQDGFRGGFDDVQLSENAWKVSFTGNAYTSSEKAANYSLLRCADICLDNGYSYFVIRDANQSTSTSVHTTPITSYSTPTGYGGYTTNNYGGNVSMQSRPSASNVILCYKSKPKEVGMVYDARFLKESLGSKLGVQ